MKKTRTLKPQQPQQPPPPSASRRKFRAWVRSSPRQMVMKAGPKWPGGRRGPQNQGETNTATTSPSKKQETASAKKDTKPASSDQTPSSMPAIIPEPTPETPASPTKRTASRKKTKPAHQPEVPMETSTNLKKRRDSGEGAAKKCAQNNPILRQVPPLNLQLHCNHHLHHYLHHLLSLKKFYNHHNLPNKWTLSPPTRTLPQTVPSISNPPPKITICRKANTIEPCSYIIPPLT